LAALYLVGYILVYLLMSTYLTNLTLTNLHLGENDRAAMAWIKENTATDSKFVLITPGTDYPMRDPVQEWFPALTERTSLTTLQGQEWILGPNFAKAMNDFRNLQACVTQNIDCVVGQTSIPSKTIDYIYISKTVNNQDCNSTGGCQQAQKFIQSARGAGRFKLVYENNDVAILQAE